MSVKLLILSFILVTLSFIGLALRIIFVRGGKFPQFMVGKNKEMQKRGITRPKDDENRIQCSCCDTDICQNQ